MTPGPTKNDQTLKRLSDSKGKIPSREHLLSFKNNNGEGMEEAKENKDPASDLRNFGSRGGLQQNE
jgi:hypothetical protein